MRKFSGKSLLIATHNQGKLEEIADLVHDLGIQVSGSAEHGLPEPVEDGKTFIENARIKAHSAAQITKIPALADDSGIEIDALDGKPGVYTADWAETPNGRDFGLAMTRARDELESIAASKPWTARFCCTFVLAWPDGHDEVFEGAVEGELVWPMRGTQGHGYDPMFQPNGHLNTFGEMDRWKKNRMSHRAKAFEQLRSAFMQ